MGKAVEEVNKMVAWRTTLAELPRNSAFSKMYKIIIHTNVFLIKNIKYIYNTIFKSKSDREFW